VLLFNAESNVANEAVPMFLDNLLDNLLDHSLDNLLDKGQIPGPVLVSAQD